MVVGLQFSTENHHKFQVFPLCDGLDGPVLRNESTQIFFLKSVAASAKTSQQIMSPSNRGISCRPATSDPYINNIDFTLIQSH